MMRKIFLSGVLVWAGALGAADWSDAGSDEFPLSPPPARGSAADRQDFETILKYQARRTQDQCELARHQLHPDFENLFGNADLLTAGQMRKARPLIERAMRLTQRVATYHKRRFRRPRPYQTDRQIQPCIQRPSGATAYPSAHAAVGAVAGCVLAQLYPEKAAALTAHGQQIGELRVIAGVHHPTDVDAGQELGAAICERIIEDERL